MSNGRVQAILKWLWLGALAALALGFGGEGRASGMGAQERGGRIHKVIALPGEIEALQPGMSLWHDYGGFALYRVTDEALSGLSAAGGGRWRLADEMDWILLDAHPFDTQTGAPRLPGLAGAPEPAGPALQLVQFVGPIKPEWLAAIEAAGARPVHYIAHNAYLVWADAPARSRLSGLAGAKDFLQYSAPYGPDFKLGPTLRERAGDPQQVLDVVIQMVRHPASGASERVIAGLALEAEATWTPVLAFQNARVRLRAADLAAVVALPDVYWIGERLPRRLFDEVQGQILAGNLEPGHSGPAGPGYLAWLESLGFSQDPADYPVVDIVDDGIGDGTLDSGDATLHVLGQPANPSRLAYLGNCTSAADGGGPDGHGHLNASIAGGYDSRAGAPFQDEGGYRPGLGINPFGRLAGTRIFAADYDISRCGGMDTGVIRASYLAGGRISSNSWGCADCSGTYDESSQAYDVAARDALPEVAGNQPVTFLFAAGNEGPNPGTISSPGNAKNVITVGASENDRPGWTDGCGVQSSGADDAMDVADFSGRGPAPGGRVKPEVVAPGTHVQGTASTNAAYSGDSVCNRYFPPGQQVFAASTGTSHATPAVAGIASLIHYWLRATYGLEDASPAMIKAYLVAHPTYLTGAGAGDLLPSNAQGFGMPNLALAFDEAARYLVDQTAVLDNPGETWTLELRVADPNRPVRVVLAYTDQAGAIGTSPQVNDLDLRVQAGGDTYLGNRFSGAWSLPGGAPDDRNNLEAVFLEAGLQGSLVLSVLAANLPGDGIPNFGDVTDQDFALVCYNCVQTALWAEPGAQQACTWRAEDLEYAITVDDVLGFDSPVTLQASGQPPGSALGFDPNPVTPPGTSRMTLSNLAAAPAGSYRIDLAGSDADTIHRAPLWLHLFDALPGQPSLLAPADGAGSQPLRPTLSWSAAAQAGGYTLELASDPGFLQIVETRSGLQETFYVPRAALSPNRQYYWRVWATNACGEGESSPAFRFSTLPLPGECPLGTAPAVLYATDVDQGTAGWNAGSAPVTWEISDVRAHSGAEAFLATDVNFTSDQRLTSPPIALPSGLEPLVLEFWNYQEIERDSASDLCYDGALLEISLDGGRSWAQVPNEQLLTDPYDAPVNAAFNNPLGGRYAWCGNPQDWLNSVVALDSYAGQRVQFRFRLGTDNSVGQEGWYVDDVVVHGCEPAEAGGVSLSPDQAGEGQPGQVLRYPFAITNRGASAERFLLAASGAWQVDLSQAESGLLQPGESVLVSLSVSIPKDAGEGAEETITLEAVSATDPAVRAQARATTRVRWRRLFLPYLPHQH